MTDMQAAFISSFLGAAEYQASVAARMAGYRWPDKQGWILRRHPRIAPVIDAEIRRRHPSWAAMNDSIRQTEADRKAAEAKELARKEARRAYARSRA